MKIFNAIILIAAMLSFQSNASELKSFEKLAPTITEYSDIRPLYSGKIYDVKFKVKNVGSLDKKTNTIEVSTDKAFFTTAVADIKNINLDFNSHKRAKLAHSLLTNNNFEILFDYSDLKIELKEDKAIFPENTLFIYNKETKKIYKLSKYINHMVRENELKTGDYEGIVGTFNQIGDFLFQRGRYTPNFESMINNQNRSQTENKKIVETGRAYRPMSPASIDSQ